MIAQLKLAEQGKQPLSQGCNSALNTFEQQITNEWTVGSGVNQTLFERTVEIVSDTSVDPYTHESSYPIHEALNWKLTRFGWQARQTEYAVLILNDDGSVWQAKLSHPRWSENGKLRKYEMPKGSSSRAWLPKDMPLEVWQQIAQRNHLLLSECDRLQGFRSWLVDHPEIPVVVCEGAKKAAALLSLGYAAVALPGIFNGYRKESQGLIDDLQQLAVPDRAIYICFDRDLKPKTIESVNLAIRKLGSLFTQQGCQVRVIQLPGPEKGVDDFIVGRGEQAFETLVAAALPLNRWNTNQYWELTYKPTLTLNQRYLSPLPFPKSGFAFVKSPKGTGKTTALEPLIQQAIQTARKVLVITHRIQLGKAICNRIGIDWIEGIHQSPTQGLLGYGLCIDSLHPRSQASFNPQDWEGAIVIFDEVEQVIWHLLNSSTCSEKRVSILETLKELIQVVADSGGLVIGQDADLSDISIQYLLGLVETPVHPWIAINRWKPTQGWNVQFYNTPDPTALMSKMRQQIAAGPIFICVDAQKAKSRLSSINLEAYLKGEFPQKRILRVDSESVSDPDHPAYGLAEQLHHVIAQYDIVIATPTIGTGVSFDHSGHFVGVFGIFHGTTPDSESRQALARVRDPVSRYVWAKPFGPGKIGNGSCNYWEVARSTTQHLRYNLQLLRDIDFDLDAVHDPVTLRTWAKMAARVNTSLWSFREELRLGLEAEGHSVTVLSDLDTSLEEDVQGAIALVQKRYLQHEAQQIASATTLTETEYLALKDQRAKSVQDRCAERKYNLVQRYGIEVTPELKLKDDAGWYNQLRLHYYLLNDVTLVQQRDLRELTAHLQRGRRKLTLQDVKLLGAQVQALRSLDIPKLLDPTVEIRATDAIVQSIAQQAIQYRADLKTILNVTVNEQMSEIQIIQVLIEKLGLKLQCQKQERKLDGSRQRVYQYTPPADGREEIFAAWQHRDLKNQLHPKPGKLMSDGSRDKCLARKA